LTGYGAATIDPVDLSDRLAARMCRNDRDQRGTGAAHKEPLHWMTFWSASGGIYGKNSSVLLPQESMEK
jgi:hypothetical protein